MTKQKMGAPKLATQKLGGKARAGGQGDRAGRSVGAAQRASQSGGGGPGTQAKSAGPVSVWTPAQWEAAVRPLLAGQGLAWQEAQVGQLVGYVQLLQKWNATYNLTALRDPADMLTHHLADCLAVLAPLSRHLDQGGAPSANAAPSGGVSGVVPSGVPFPASVKLLDVGSGGGLPGVVLAIARPDLQVTCVDTVGKKAAFIRQVGAELKLPNLRAEHARVEQLTGRYDVVTSRAFASLLDFTALTRHLLAPHGVWMAMKGKTPEDEVLALPGDVAVFHVEQLQVPDLQADRCVVWMRLVP